MSDDREMKEFPDRIFEGIAIALIPSLVLWAVIIYVGRLVWKMVFP